MPSHGVIHTPSFSIETTPSISTQGNNVIYPVHDLNRNCTSKNPNLTIIFFHGFAYGINDEWKQTWTTQSIGGRKKCICWSQMWIPKDLNDNVKILSLSYDSNVVASIHNDVTDIGKNLIQSLVINSRCDYLPLYGHLTPCHVFESYIIACILTSLNKLFVWNIIVLSNALGQIGGDCCL
ncbi:unnamed protein product [Sphagnum jensenii]|uniref:Uncharacterized protein n=1 Tax=Sphagnum jensenii TaxID=128206 RepID=A0ABP0VFV8_9BRYO